MIMKNKGLTVFSIILLSIVVVLLILFLIFSLSNKNFFRNLSLNSKVSDVKIVDEIYDENFEQINIDTKAVNVEIKKSNDSQIKLIIYGDKERTNISTSSSELNIYSHEKDCFGFCFNRTISKIELYIPSDYDKTIKITSNYGDIVIDEFKNLNLNVKMEAGNIEIGSIKYADIVNSYGDITINGYSEKLYIKEKCGDVEINEVDDVTVQNNYGDIKINKINSSLDIKDDCGDIEIDFISINKNSTIHNNLGDIEIGTTNEIFIDAKTNLGDTKINNNYHKSDVVLKITNSLGDIKVEN